MAILAMASMTAVAVAAGSTTLATGKASVKGKTKTVVVDSSGVTLYTLSGESAGHLKCVSSACLKAWPPDKVSATAKVTKAKGISGAASKLHRGTFYQVTLNGRPLYRFVGDAGKKGSAKGEGITAFGGTWHVVGAP
jgi:predicted lipoprotein with Yx(FWY)xxD motif